MDKSIVSITSCDGYAGETVRERMEEAVEAAGAASLFSAGKTVLLKPNLLSASQPPENAVNTHPEFVRGAVRYCRGKGCDVLIGDSCGSLSPGSTAGALEISGVAAVAAETGAGIVNFDAAGFEEATVPDGKVLRNITICRAVREADVVVTLPKLKTHGLTLLTGAVKNQFGCVPGRHKKKVHLVAPKPNLLSEAVVDIFSVVRPHLALMDAIVAMEGNGPAGGKPRKLDLILCSLDAVALDAVAGRIIGYGPDEILTTVSAAGRGLGNGELKDIEIRGEAPCGMPVKDFRRPSAGRRRWLWRMVPATAGRIVIRGFGASYPAIIHRRCRMCRECVVNCPTAALRMDSCGLSLDRRRCIGCYCCAEACPHGAVEFRRRGLSRFFDND